MTADTRNDYARWLRQHFPGQVDRLINADVSLQHGVVRLLGEAMHPFKAVGALEGLALERLVDALVTLYAPLAEPDYGAEVRVDLLATFPGLPEARGITLNDALTTYRKSALAVEQRWTLTLLNGHGREINRVTFEVPVPPKQGRGAHSLDTAEGVNAYTIALAKALKGLVKSGVLTDLKQWWRGTGYEKHRRILHGFQGGNHRYSLDVDRYSVEVARVGPGKVTGTFQYKLPGSKWPRDPGEVAAEVEEWVREHP